MISASALFLKTSTKLLTVLDHHQAQARIGEAIKAVMACAEGKNKPLAIEALDFAKKKAALEDAGARYARLLSSLSYINIVATLKARAHDAGLRSSPATRPTPLSLAGTSLPSATAWAPITRRRW